LQSQSVRFFSPIQNFPCQKFNLLNCLLSTLGNRGAQNALRVDSWCILPDWSDLLDSPYSLEWVLYLQSSSYTWSWHPRGNDWSSIRRVFLSTEHQLQIIHTFRTSIPLGLFLGVTERIAWIFGCQIQKCDGVTLPPLHFVLNFRPAQKLYRRKLEVQDKRLNSRRHHRRLKARNERD